MSLELKYPVWSHIYFAQDKKDAGEQDDDSVGEEEEGGNLV